jgi:hypothetical protein
MAKWANQINSESLDGLYLNHPYLRLLQKADWNEYLTLIAQLYDLLEDENSSLPYEVLRSFLIQYYSEKRHQNVDQKVLQFVSMTITELDVFKDRHDHLGNRFIETTRAGKDLLKLFEELLSKKVRFTGLTAETMLGALNGLLANHQNITKEEALIHHREKVKAYQADIKRIETHGVAKAELLPGEFSKDELLNQAEESALHILTAVEDVKQAVDGVRKKLIESYLKNESSVGKSINVIADFYEELLKSPEFKSYSQAFDLLSYIEGIGGRFKIRDVEELISTLLKKELLDSEDLRRTHLYSFKQKFSRAHTLIEDRKRTQLQLLQQQVLYAITQDSRRVESDLREILASAYSNKEETLNFFTEESLKVIVPSQFDWGPVFPNDFEIPVQIPVTPLELSELNEHEARLLAKALLEAEEATIQKILTELKTTLEFKGSVVLSEYEIKWGLAEFYVLSEADLLSPEILKTEVGFVDLQVATKWGDFVIRNCANYKYSIRGSQ